MFLIYDAFEKERIEIVRREDCFVSATKIIKNNVYDNEHSDFFKRSENHIMRNQKLERKHFEKKKNEQMQKKLYGEDI